MALFGMGANVQCNGYLTGCYSTKDFVFGGESNPWTSSNAKGVPKNDGYQNGFLPVPFPGHLLGYNKELLKQTILKHEAIFRNQIHELHHLYQKQREIMDELSRRELYKHNLRIDISWSSSSLSHVQSKIAPKVCCSSKLPWATGESSDLIAKSIQLPLGSMQEKSMQVAPAPIPVQGFLEHSKTLKSNYRKVGRKILDLRLPADEYIDSEEGESVEDGRVSKVAGLSAYPLNGISQVEHQSDEKRYGAISNNFADLNEPFVLENEVAMKFDDMVGDSHLRNIPFHELSRRMNLGTHNLPHEVIQYPKKRQDILVFSGDPPPKQQKKHEQLSSTNNAGHSGNDFESFAKGIDTEMPSVSSESLSKKLEQVNELPCFCPLDQIKGPLSRKNISAGESSAETNGPTMDRFLLGSSRAQLVSEDAWDPKNTNLNVMPAVSSEATAFQSMWVSDKENKFQDSRQGLPWLKEKPVPKRQLNEESKVSTQMEPVLLKHYVGGIHGFELKKIEESDLCREKILVFPMNRKPHTSSNLHFSQAFPSKVCQNQSDNQKFEEIERGCKLDVNIPCNLPDLGEQIPDGEHYMKNEIEKKHKWLEGIIDLNSCMHEDENLPVTVNFQAPESPENKECSPLRGESDEKQLEMSYPPAGQEDQVGVAAEALVSISACVAQNSLQMTPFPPSEPSVSSPLHWFAGIASSIMDHPEYEVKMDCGVKTVDDLEEFLPTGIDYFEAMTLKLTETENLDCCCNTKISSQNEKEDGSTSTSQPRKGWTKRWRRQKQKDFQSEILPSLASLSRYEVTEDLQTIGGLIEAANTHLETGSLRSVRRRKQSHASASNITDTLLKHLTNGTEKSGLTLSWEKICRKPRGKRYPASNPQFFLGQICN